MDNHNVYDILNNEELYFCLAGINGDEGKLIDAINSSAIFCHLYYEKGIEYYLNYLINVPSDIDIYIYASEERVLKICRVFLNERSNTFFIKKKSYRGRDVSTLLVDCRPMFLKYRYACFIHDKGVKSDERKEDVEFWKYNIWENLIGCRNNIFDILNIFEKNSEIGLLVPPEPMGKRYRCFYSNMWNKNYPIAKLLKDELQIDSDIDARKNPISLGTAFWCKTCSLYKLMTYKWKYEDFPDEPLPDDYTISHAIERLFPYVAQDAGYKTGMILSTEYVRRLLPKVRAGMQEAFDFLRNEHGINNIAELESYTERKEKLGEFCKNYDSIYLYGAGRNGKNCLKMLRSIGIEPTGYIVTNIDGDTSVDGKKIYEIDKLIADSKTGVIICVDYHVQKEIERNLRKRNINNFISFL